MPQSNDLDGACRCLEGPVIQVVADTAKKNPTHSGEFGIARKRAYVRLRGDQLQGLVEFLA